MTFGIGERVGPYQIIEQLGSGGMATVFKGYHPALDRYVAIKVLHPAFKQDPNFLTRFQREARIVAKLEHPHIVPVYDFDEVDGQPYLVMRFVEGETLKARLTRGGLSLDDTVRILRPVGEALSYAHGRGVLHRDVKPSNVLLTPAGGVFLADFGLARMAQAGESTLSQDSLLGTPQYISPEQAQGLPDLDVRTDVYSLGVVMYELLLGRVPYQADTPYAVIHDHIYAPLPLPHSVKPGFPEALERVLLKALTKDRADRYASIADLMTAFEQAYQAVVASAPAQVVAPTELSALLEPAVPAESNTLAIPSASAGATAASDSKATRRLSPEPARAIRRSWLAIGVIALVAVVVIALLAARAARVSDQTPPSPPVAGSDVAAADSQLGQLRDQFGEANTAVLQGDTGQARGQFADVAQQAERLLEADGAVGSEQQAQLHVLAGNSWLAANQPDKALPHFETVARETPGNAEAQASLAAAYLSSGDLDAADAALNASLRTAPDLSSAHALKACSLLKRNEPLLAARELRQSGLLEAKPPVAPWIRLVLADLDCRPERFR